MAANSSKAFQSAKPEIKVAWDSIAAAVKANEYATALLGCRKLRAEPGITPEQIQAVDKTSAAVNEQMYKAFNDGDAKAKASIEEMRKATGR